MIVTWRDLRRGGANTTGHSDVTTSVWAYFVVNNSDLCRNALWPASYKLSCTTVVVHNRDQAEIFQNTLIERTPKAAFRALDFISKTFYTFLLCLQH